MALMIGITALVAASAVVAALIIQRRTHVDAPTQPDSYEVPAMLDRADFARPDAPWLVVVFSSATCLSCQDAWEKVRHLESDEVAVQDVEVSTDKELHERYGIDAVPMIVVADDEGVTRASFVGVPTAADLWAALAELRS
ncbi:MAG TPA: thioredoxin domain-containing protein [Acidimicrobiales bacterium]|nr:thioredoxin domain-containing protein [Acidimicrobiales bacterium]